jgi:exopolyphosphatase/guanosine-5'-triphosphate,3'-diphosphate pyrophosphatase
VGGTRRGVKCLHAHYAFHLAGGDDPVGVEVARTVEPIHADERPGRAAAIDQGTNSIRLLVVEPGEPAGADPAELARDMVITRLGQGVDRAGRFEPAAFARTVAVLETYARRARALHAVRFRVAATSAVRDAADRDAFADAVRDVTGAELEVISGEREAGLSFLGATHGLDPSIPSPLMVLDVGGGSTELTVGVAPAAPGPAVSLRIGSVRLTERYVRTDPPSEADLEAMRAAIDAALGEAERPRPWCPRARPGP